MSDNIAINKAKHATKIINDILIELHKAKEKHPIWHGSNDPVIAVAIMIEEAGESMQAALNLKYENGSRDALIKELHQTAAMCIRVLENL